MWGIPWWLSGKESTCQCRNARDAGSHTESGRSPGVGNGNLLQYSFLKNSMDKEPDGLRSMGSQELNT